MPPDLVVTVQLLDAAGALIAQRDMRPMAGTQATSGWAPGDVWPDRIALEVPRGTPPGKYSLILGLYDPGSGERWAPDAEAAVSGGFFERDGALEIRRVRVRAGAAEH